MDLRWLWLAIVLALVAGNAAGPAPSMAIRGEQGDALDGAGLLPPHAQRSQKRTETPRRDARRGSHERPAAPPPPAAIAPPTIRVALLEWIAAATGSGRTLGPSARARAPPAA